MKKVVIGVRAMRTGRTSPAGKMTETVKFCVTEDLRNAIGYIAAEASKPVSESLRSLVETTFFGHLHSLHVAVSTGDINPLEAPVADVDMAINALATAARIDPEEYRRQVLIEHAFGVFHAQRMASEGCE